MSGLALPTELARATDGQKARGRLGGFYPLYCCQITNEQPEGTERATRQGAGKPRPEGTGRGGKGGKAERKRTKPTTDTPAKTPQPTTPHPKTDNGRRRQQTTPAESNRTPAHSAKPTPQTQTPHHTPEPGPRHPTRGRTSRHRRATRGEGGGRGGTRRTRMKTEGATLYYGEMKERDL